MNASAGIPHHEQVLSAIEPLVEAGFAVHRLRARSKAPLADSWSTAPVQTMADLRRLMRENENIGVRLGEPSKVAGHYLHVIDLDIRDNAKLIEAKAALASFLPEYEALPFVISGSGGESRHFYFLTERPFRSKKLAHSVEKITDTAGKQHWAYEVELFGTGKQVAMPPSIHPDTGLPYRWGRAIDLGDLLLGAGPFVGAERVAKWAPEAAPLAPDEDEEFGKLVRAQPMGLTRAEIDKCLAALPLDAWCEDRDGWLTVGMALHHEFEGRIEGQQVWNAFSKQAAGKYDEKDQARVWKSFESSRRPTRMATLIKAAAEARFKDDGYGDDVDLGEDDDLDEDDLLGGASNDMTEVRPALEWTSLLDKTEDGGVKPTPHNVEMIVRHDERIKGVPRLNEFTLNECYRGEPGYKAFSRRRAKPCRQLTGKVWELSDPLNGEIWLKRHTASVRSVISAPRTQGGYGFSPAKEMIEDAIAIAACDSPFHPIKDYLESLVWDGVDRLDTLYIRYLRVADTPYHRATARLPLVAAVTRVYEPGHKWDYVPILEGAQGIRKSTFVAMLGKHWFGELNGDFGEREKMVAKMQGKWILEIPELSGFRRHEVQDIKAAISTNCDTVRLSYRPDAKDYQRQSVFFGTTNDEEYLRDDTGNRRFWPIKCCATEIDTARLGAEVDQLWAEALTIYRRMRVAQPTGTLPLYLTDTKAIVAALEIQESRRVVSVADEIAGQISQWLDGPMTDEAGFELESDPLLGSAPRRNVVCGKMIWCEMMFEPISRYGQDKQQQIGAALKKVPGWFQCSYHVFPKYGRQRAFRRKGSGFD
jgi:hypothetical protein